MVGHLTPGFTEKRKVQKINSDGTLAITLPHRQIEQSCGIKIEKGDELEYILEQNSKETFVKIPLDKKL